MLRAACIRFIATLLIALASTHFAPPVAQAQSAEDIRVRNAWAVQLQRQGKYTEAVKLAEETFALAERRLGAEHPLTLLSVNNLGSLYQAQGRYIEAEPLLKLALKGYEKTQGREHPDTLRSANNLGGLYQAQGRYIEAEPLWNRALAGYEKALGVKHPDTLRSVNNLGFLYRVQERYSEAEPLLTRALAGREKALGPRHPDTLESVNNLAFLYQAQGRYSEAEPLYKRALEGREKVLSEEHPSTLESVNNLGFLYRAQGRYSEAEPLYKRALAGNEKALGAEHPLTLASVNNLGFLYEAQGRYSEAEPLYKRALAGNEKALGMEHPHTLSSVSNFAALYFAQHDWGSAAQLWRRSTAAIAKRVQRGAESASLAGKKQSEALQNDWQFWGLVKTTYRLTHESRAQEAVTSAEMFQAAQWALSSEAAQSLAQMALRGAKGDPVLGALVWERQDLADEWQRREQIQAAAFGQDQAERDVNAETGNRERMDAIDKRISKIDEELKVKFPDYYANASPAPLAVEDVQAQLGKDEVLVLFLDTPDWQPTPEETFIWVVTKTEMRWLRSDLGKAALTREVAALRCGLDHTLWRDPTNWSEKAEGDKQRKAEQTARRERCIELTGITGIENGMPLPFDHERAHRLYKALFGEAEDLMRGKHLLLVPSGPLTQLPFQVLVTQPPASDDHRAVAWLARSHALTVLPAVSSLKALRVTGHPSAAPQQLIGFGNPLLDGPADDPEGFHATRAKTARERQVCPRQPWERIAALFGFKGGVAPFITRGGQVDISEIKVMSPLPETADELCDVARVSGADPEEIRLGANATEAEVKRLSGTGKLAQFRAVYFSTHGLTAGQLTTAAEPGLVLTPPEAATETDDGYLTASEIAALKLDADWVILSACNTATGSATSAEALSGLARAFFYAQARALLVSHWEVETDASVKLITAAMAEIARDKHIGRAEALRRAMITMIDKGEPYQAHPQFWAPFAVVGEGAR
jgi:CHAT domain-containing protein/tetratricopeptide (TPR) repeat protein